MASPQHIPITQVHPWSPDALCSWSIHVFHLLSFLKIPQYHPSSMYSSSPKTVWCGGYLSLITDLCRIIFRVGSDHRYHFIYCGIQVHDITDHDITDYDITDHDVTDHDVTDQDIRPSSAGRESGGILELKSSVLSKVTVVSLISKWLNLKKASRNWKRFCRYP